MRGRKQQENTMSRVTTASFAVTVLLTGSFAACDKSPTRPSIALPPAGPTTTATPSLQSIRIESNVTWALPTEVKVRAYDAVITQTGPRLSVALSGAPLTAANFTGTVSGDSVTFEIRGVTVDYYFYFDRAFDLVEQLASDRLLVTSGRAATTRSTSGLSGTLDGVIGVMRSLSGSYPNFTSYCVGRHEFVLTRRS
jgi:hypothetical protein